MPSNESFDYRRQKTGWGGAARGRDVRSRDNLRRPIGPECLAPAWRRPHRHQVLVSYYQWNHFYLMKQPS